MPDYIPDADRDYDLWLDNLVSYGQTNLVELGLSEADLAPLLASQPQWQQVYGEHRTAQTAAEIARQAKDDQRQITEEQARTLVRLLQANPNLSDVQRVALGITVRSSTRSSTPPPSTRPLGRLEQPGPLRQVIHFVDEATPNRRAKPQGVRGCQIWVYIGTSAPMDPGTFQYLGTDTRTPYLNEFEPEEGGQIAHYRLRWVNSKEEPGPWSDLISGMILV